MALLRTLFWVVLFVFFTFCFVVLFEYGPHEFTSGFQKEFARVKAAVTKTVADYRGGKGTEKKKP